MSKLKEKYLTHFQRQFNYYLRVMILLSLTTLTEITAKNFFLKL